MSIQCWYINAGAGAPFWYEVDNQPSGTGTKYYNPSTNVLTIVSGAVGDTGHDTYYCIVHYLV